MLKEKENETFTHKHRAISNHTPGTQRMFFALGHQLGFHSVDLKDKAKKKYNVECFNDLTTGNMCDLIDKLDDLARKKGLPVRRSEPL